MNKSVEEFLEDIKHKCEQLVDDMVALSEDRGKYFETTDHCEEFSELIEELLRVHGMKDGIIDMYFPLNGLYRLCSSFTNKELYTSKDSYLTTATIISDVFRNVTAGYYNA